MLIKDVVIVDHHDDDDDACECVGELPPISLYLLLLFYPNKRYCC